MTEFVVAWHVVGWVVVGLFVVGVFVAWAVSAVVEGLRARREMAARIAAGSPCCGWGEWNDARCGRCGGCGWCCYGADDCPVSEVQP